MTRLLAIVLFALLVAGCGSSGPPQSEDYGNLLVSPGVCSTTTTTECDGNGDCPVGENCNGLWLVEQEHPTGWTRPECFACHEIRNIHTVNRTGEETLDLASVRVIVQNQGEASCQMCHGGNGISP